MGKNMVRKSFWNANQNFEMIISKPANINFELNGSSIFLSWLPSIGCVEGYRIFGGISSENLELIGETHNTKFQKAFEKNDYPYFIGLKTFYQNFESDVVLIKIRSEEESKKIDPIITQSQVQISESIKNQNIKSEFPFGLCTCCEITKPLMKLKNNMVCSSKNRNIYKKQGDLWVQEKKYILSDLEIMDQTLRQNSAYVGLGGFLLR